VYSSINTDRQVHYDALLKVSASTLRDLAIRLAEDSPTESNGNPESGKPVKVQKLSFQHPKGDAKHDGCLIAFKPHLHLSLPAVRLDFNDLSVFSGWGVRAASGYGKASPADLIMDASVMRHNAQVESTRCIPTPSSVPSDVAFCKHNIALIVAFQRGPRGPPLVVANAHLYSNPKFEYVKFWQTVYLTRNVESFRSIVAVHAGAAADASVPVVIAGDFNSTPLSDAYRFLSDASFPVEDIHDVDQQYKAKMAEAGTMIEEADEKAENTFKPPLRSAAESELRLRRRVPRLKQYKTQNYKCVPYIYGIR
jgi:hypothetical protein